MYIYKYRKNYSGEYQPTPSFPSLELHSSGNPPLEQTQFQWISFPPSTPFSTLPLLEMWNFLSISTVVMALALAALRIALSPKRPDVVGELFISPLQLQQPLLMGWG